MYIHACCYFINMQSFCCMYPDVESCCKECQAAGRCRADILSASHQESSGALLDEDIQQRATNNLQHIAELP